MIVIVRTATRITVVLNDLSCASKILFCLKTFRYFLTKYLQFLTNFAIFKIVEKYKNPMEKPEICA